ncbi:MAG: hypothetical protein IT481_08530 [Gammaproteobacteria bacterium]|nr:hypothetical protein [Gammaproteobacteria bacterium]
MFHSLYGRRLGLNENALLLDGAPVGALPQAWGRGSTFYVDSAIGGTEGTSPQTALATLAAAVAKCAANQGDVIVMLPGHAETISSNAALSLSVAGIRVIGLGVGDNRPKLTIDTANTATVNVTAANIMISNIRIVANFLSIAAALTLTTAKNLTLDRVAFQETSSVLNFLNAIKSTGAANTVDGLTVQDCTWNGLGTTSVNAFILAANDIDGLKVVRNRVKLARTADAAAIVISAGVLTNADIGDNAVYTAQTAQANGTLVNVGGTTSTGWVYRNFVQTLSTSSDKLFTTTVGLGAFENRVSGAVGATGFVIPAVDS